MLLFSDNHWQNIWDKFMKSRLIGLFLGSFVNIWYIYFFQISSKIVETAIFVGGLETCL